tara:strand:- start:25722 stop:26456 length:735 start_codon:yes stop_codon:yes gene_type:complete
MRHSESKVIFITGASSGIGAAIARKAAAAGHIVVLAARRKSRLDQLAQEISESGGRARSHTLDVRSRSDFEKVVQTTIEEFGHIDVLVSNAGVMPLSSLGALKVDEWERMIDVNIKGVLYGIAAVLPLMEARQSGQIISVASIGAHMVVPSAAVYCATKYAVWAISDGLRQESDTLRVTTVSPGVVDTELADSITDEAARAGMESFRAIALKPEAIANAVLYALDQPADVDVSEIIVRPTASQV